MGHDYRTSADRDPAIPHRAAERTAGDEHPELERQHTTSSGRRFQATSSRQRNATYIRNTRSEVHRGSAFQSPRTLRRLGL